MRTWNATVRRDVRTEEVNMKTSSKRYHYDTKHGIRKNKGEQLTRLFTFEEECDRNRIQSDIKEMPSPRGTTWSWYIGLSQLLGLPVHPALARPARNANNIGNP
ncbi:uncharacterized protein LOC129576407 [Sitodiplosis mosellana]|uniref:uncharacterized protein LOC129576407 n=1 Tax=Sitodiplosis mosellana TaxID=263140 RepID=UPI0024444F77|nr:uncharacterized protein LOC129576407 [Sitodiplosis mosellana]